MYAPPAGYAPRPPAGQRQMQYNPAAYHHPTAPPSPPGMNMAAAPSGYNPGVYIPAHPVGPPGRPTPQPMVGAGGYVPYANLQGVIGGVNRSSSLEQPSGEEAPPPYSPPQRPLIRGQMQPPNLQVPVNVQNNMYTPITPSNSYQQQPPPQAPVQATGYPPVQNQQRIASQPGMYHPVQAQVPQQQPVQAVQNAQYPPPRVAPPAQPQVPIQQQPQRITTSPPTIAPGAPGARSPEDMEPPSPTSQRLPPTGASRERDSLPLRRQPPPAAGEGGVPNRRATMGVPPPPPPAIPPPPSGPPPGGASMPVAVRRQTMDVIPNGASQAPANPIAQPTQTPTSSVQLPTGMPIPPPPSRPPPKSIQLAPAPLGKRRDKGKGINRSDSISSEMSVSELRDITSPLGSAPYSAGTLPFRRNSPPASGNTPNTSGFPGSATIQPQSIMRSQKSSGDLASGGLRTTTPKDVRFVIPDDESEYESTADGESRSNSAVEPSPGFAAAAAPTTPRTPGTPSRQRVASSQQVPQFATIAEEGPTDATNGNVTETWPNEKEALAAKNPPSSAPANELRFNTRTGLEKRFKEKERSLSISGNLNGYPPQAGSSAAGAQGRNVQPRVFPDDNPEDLDLPPFYHEAIERHTDMILTEATAPTDEKRLNVFVDFVIEEARMRGEMYNNALEVLGGGLFPSNDPEYMTPEQQVAEFERREYEKRVIEQFANNPGAGPASPAFGLKRRQTIKEQKARAGEYLEARRSRSNPTTPREPPKNLDFPEQPSLEDVANGVVAGGSPQQERVLSPVPEPAFLDLQPLLAIVPPFPRQFPASDNSHPSLQKSRKAIAELKDLKMLHKLKFDFATSVPRIQDENAAEARARKIANQDYIQRLFSEGRVTYEEMDRLNAEFEQREAGIRADETEREFNRFAAEVISPGHGELMERIDKATANLEAIQTDISSSAKANQTIREGPELLEKLNIMKSLFEARELLHTEAAALIAERDNKYKEVNIAQMVAEGDMEGVREADEFFGEAAKKNKLDAEKSAVERAKSFLEKVEKDVTTGVESEVSNFWDVAPTLTELLDKVPGDLENFRPLIPEEEFHANANYKKFPLLYLKKKLDYIGNSIYQHTQAQMRLLDFSVDITLLWTNAKWSLGECERSMAGEEEQRAVSQVERQKHEEEIKQTKNWEEKLKIVKEEWTQSVGNRLMEIKKRIIDQLAQQEGWSNELL